MTKHTMNPVSVLRKSSYHEFIVTYEYFRKRGTLNLFKYVLWHYRLNKDKEKQKLDKFMKGVYT